MQRQAEAYCRCQRRPHRASHALEGAASRTKPRRRDPGLPAGYRPVGSLKIAELLDRDLDELPALAARGAREPAT